MDSSRSATVRRAFAGAADGFCELVHQIGPDDWDRSALGLWSVRDLTGHTSRALSTVETYLGAPAAVERLMDAVDYFVATRAALADPAAVAQRGRDAGLAMGADPFAFVGALAERIMSLVGRSADDAPVATPVGAMSLIAYLPTRVFELTVHSLDLARALGLEPPDSLAGGIALSCELAGRLAAVSPQAAEFLLALTGRAPLSAGSSVV